MRAAYRREQQQGADVVFEYGLHVLHVRRVDEIVDVRECAEPDVVRHPQHAVLRLDQPLLLRQDLHRLEDDLLLFRDLRPLARLLTLLHHRLDHCAHLQLKRRMFFIKKNSIQFINVCFLRSLGNVKNLWRAQKKTTLTRQTRREASANVNSSPTKHRPPPRGLGNNTCAFKSERKNKNIS